MKQLIKKRTPAEEINTLRTRFIISIVFAVPLFTLPWDT